ncbi:MAG: hypothetical protein COC23_08105 [Hyphomicrobiales bacterium]|nr:MAG: hypothetical protein COC23_08105 [Hyphomicrobiales bacterium]
MQKLALFARAALLFAGAFFVVVPLAHAANNEEVGAALEKLVRSGESDFGSDSAKADGKIVYQEVDYIEKCAEYLRLNRDNFLFIKEKFVTEKL